MILQRLKDYWKERKADRKRFPTVWMSYKRRIRDDVEQAYKQQGGAAFFSDNYVLLLGNSAQRLEGWQIWLFATQTAILGFLLVGLVSNDSSISLFGISIKKAPGIKEVLLGIVSTLAALGFAIATLKDTRLFIIEKIIELKTDSAFLDFAKIAAPSSFNSSIYVTKPYARYIFPTKPTAALFAIPAILFLGMMLFAFGLSVALYVYVILDVYWNPTLPGKWSQIIAVYAVASQILGIFWLIRGWMPLPFRDKSVLLELERLKNTDRRAYDKLLQELF